MMDSKKFVSKKVMSKKVETKESPSITPVVQEVVEGDPELSGKIVINYPAGMSTEDMAAFKVSELKRVHAKREAASSVR